MLTNKVEGTLLDLLRISSDHGYGAVRSQIPIEQIHKARLVTSAGPSHTHQ